jgi:hypothetical protein
LVTFGCPLSPAARRKNVIERERRRTWRAILMAMEAMKKIKANIPALQEVRGGT